MNGSQPDAPGDDRREPLPPVEDRQEEEDRQGGDEAFAERSPRPEGSDDASGGGLAAGAQGSGAGPIQEQIGFYVDRLQRLQAEFENYRRRSQQDLSLRESRTIARIFRHVLPIIDEIERAADAPDGDDQPLRDGLRIILEQSAALLAEFSIEKIPAVGHPFDPRWHEAMVHHPSDETPPGEVLQELERGYRLGDTLVRPSRVVVAKDPEVK